LLTIRIANRDHTIIGIVKNTPINAVGEPPEPYLYLFYWPKFSAEATLIETQGEPVALASAARRELKSIDPRIGPLQRWATVARTNR